MVISPGLPISWAILAPAGEPLSRNFAALGDICRTAPAKRHPTETDRSSCRHSVAASFQRGVCAMFLRRRRLIATTGLAAASLGLTRIAIGQADQRPSITIAVQQIANSASLEPLR